MMQDRPLIPDPDESPEETLLTGAATEMTGLIPSGRPDREERRSYQDVLPWLPPFTGAAPAI